MALPLNAGTYVVDKMHSTVEFTVKHLGLAKVRGRFDDFDATLTVGDGLAATSVDATVAMASVNTGNSDRDAHLAGTDFFGVETAPKMTFRSATIGGSANAYKLAGELTIRGITKPVTLDVEFNGQETNPFTKGTHIGFSATGEISRGDFGISFNVPLGGDAFMVSDKVKIELELEFVPAA